MNVSTNGRRLIERNEGCVLHAYYDVVGVLTIGYGCTGRGVYVGQVITQSEADQMLSDRLAQEFEPGVFRRIGGDLGATQCQFDAMVSLAFNIGVGAFSNQCSVSKKHVLGDFQGAADAFMLWNKAGGRILSALSRRRAEERSMYLSGVVPATMSAPASGMISGSAHSRTLRLASPLMTGDDVRELQSTLNIAVDGVFGQATEAAVKKFQISKNLTPDGIVGSATWQELEGR